MEQNYVTVTLCVNNTSTLLFHPRDAMLWGTSYGPVSVCVCLSQIGVLSKRLNESCWVFFGMGASFYLSYSALKENSGNSKNKNTPVRNFVPNSGLVKVCFGMSIVEICYRFSSRRVDAPSVINWTVVGQLSWQYIRSPTVTSLSQ